MEIGPIIKNPVLDINKLVRQGTMLNQSVQNVEGDSTADQATTDLLAKKDPVIHEISVGISGEEASQYTVSGTPPLSLPNSLGKPLKAWSVDVLPYQEGTGDPAPDNVRPIHGTDKLPIYTALGADGQYKALEYITIPQGAYINTGFTSNSGTLEIRTKLQANDYSKYASVYGNYIDENTNVMRMIWATNSGSFYFNANSKAASPVTVSISPAIASSVLTIVQTRTSVVVNGTSVTATGTAGTNNNTSIALGATKVQTSATSYGLKKVYYFDISDNGVTLLQLRPAKRVSDNVVGMYDLVSNTFLTSATETACTAGTELSYYYPMHITSITLPSTVYNGTVGSDGGESRDVVYDMGDLNWYKSGTGDGRFYASNFAIPYGIGLISMWCEQYKPDGVGSQQVGYYGANNTIRYWRREDNTSLKEFYVVDERFNDANDFKTAVTGVKLVCSAVTPQTFPITVPTIPTPRGTATTWATAEDGVVDSMEVTYVGKA